MVCQRSRLRKKGNEDLEKWEAGEGEAGGRGGMRKAVGLEDRKSW